MMCVLWLISVLLDLTIWCILFPGVFFRFTLVGAFPCDHGLNILGLRTTTPATMPARSTSGFQWPGRHCLLHAPQRKAERDVFSASCMKGWAAFYLKGNDFICFSSFFLFLFSFEENPFPIPLHPKRQRHPNDGYFFFQKAGRQI